MTVVTVAAVQAAYVLMDREATLTKVERLLAEPQLREADLVVFPEAFVPGTPIWMDSRPIWDGDEEWFALLVDQAVVVPGKDTDRLGAVAREAGVYLVMGVNEREEHGTTIYNTLLYFGPDGALLNKHRKLCPPAQNGPCGAWATARPWTWSPPRSVESVDSSAGRTTCHWPGSTCTPKGSTSGWLHLGDR